MFLLLALALLSTISYADAEPRRGLFFGWGRRQISGRTRVPPRPVTARPITCETRSTFRPPTGCKIYMDGCNTCSVMSYGQTRCTKIHCACYKKGRCISGIVYGTCEDICRKTHTVLDGKGRAMLTACLKKCSRPGCVCGEPCRKGYVTGVCQVDRKTCAQNILPPQCDTVVTQAPVTQTPVTQAPGCNSYLPYGAPGYNSYGKRYGKRTLCCPTLATTNTNNNLCPIAMCAAPPSNCQYSPPTTVVLIGKCCWSQCTLPFICQTVPTPAPVTQAPVAPAPIAIAPGGCPAEVSLGGCRVRKSFIHMSQAERAEYTQAIRDISAGTGGANSALKSQYETLLTNHAINFNKGIHGNVQFLGWHRWFILTLENLLRQTGRPCLTVPFWAWEAEAADPWGSPLWGAGTDWFGAGSNNVCVSNGPFTPPWTRPTNNMCLRRRRIGNPPDMIDIITTVFSVPHTQWNTFSGLMNGIHGGVHCNIHGTMCTGDAAEAPEFFLHHANIDRLWDLYQQMSPAHQTAQSNTGTSYTNPMFLDATNGVPGGHSTTQGYAPVDLINLMNHAGGTCVHYQNSAGGLNIPGGRRRLQEDKTFNDVMTPLLDVVQQGVEVEWKNIPHLNPLSIDKSIEFIQKTRGLNRRQALEKVKKSGLAAYVIKRKRITSRSAENPDAFMLITGVKQADLIAEVAKVNQALAVELDATLTKVIESLNKKGEKTIEASRETVEVRGAINRARGAIKKARGGWKTARGGR